MKHVNLCPWILFPQWETSWVSRWRMTGILRGKANTHIHTHIFSLKEKKKPTCQLCTSKVETRNLLCHTTSISRKSNHNINPPCVIFTAASGTRAWYGSSCYTAVIWKFIGSFTSRIRVERRRKKLKTSARGYLFNMTKIWVKEGMDKPSKNGKEGTDRKRDLAFGFALSSCWSRRRKIYWMCWLYSLRWTEPRVLRNPAFQSRRKRSTYVTAAFSISIHPLFSGVHKYHIQVLAHTHTHSSQEWIKSALCCFGLASTSCAFSGSSFYLPLFVIDGSRLMQLNNDD